MNSKRQVLIPTTSNSPAADQLFTNAGFELNYGLTAAQAVQIQEAPDRDSQIAAAIEAAFGRHLETASALQALGIGGHIPVTAAVLDRAPNLEVVYIGAAGFDLIDVPAATQRGILVVNAPGGNATGVAEHAIGLMLSLSHKIAVADRQAHLTGQWSSRQELKAAHPPLSVLGGKTLGLIGCGHIGREVARLAQAFGMRVRAYDPFMDESVAAELGIARSVTLDALLGSSDHISLHTPLNDETKNLIGPKQLELMLPHACLINTARGGTVDADALAVAVAEGQIGGAGLDVTEPEPLPDGHPLFSLPNVILTPHIGGASPEMLEQSAVTAATLAVQILQGTPPGSVVNPEALEAYFINRSTKVSAGAV
ncbi:NAD(P)-dependent oxidoreductase [Arthrobacter sp. P2b]|uniref:NAD(P)-dependent oxidoreductase n=1 Tax=Arthrobacter sp. P2b TaxID=1938741 RepID=UPI0009D239DF|nr:NAD(P)-dependent oxidoreductase [Arthrobacter sp. P2b]SLK10559.1 D-3-phosphoglycerate dehydrogenase [Arthrobacter sp. P2b]